MKIPKAGNFKEPFTKTEKLYIDIIKEVILQKKEAKIAEAKYRKWWEDQGHNVPLYLLIVDEFLKYRYTQVKSSTYVTDLSIYTRFKELLIEDSTNKDFLQNYIDKYDKEYSKKEVEEIYHARNKLFKWRIREGYLNYNLMVRVIRDARKNEIPKQINYWESDDFKRFIDIVDEPMYKTAYMILYYMGFRKGELRGLTWKNVDLDNKTITVN